MAPMHHSPFYKRRATHGFFSSQQYPSVPVARDVRVGEDGNSVGDMTDHRPTTAINTKDDSTTNGGTGEGEEGGAVGEPLVQDWQEVQSPRPISDLGLQTPKRSSSVDHPLSSHPITSSSSDDEIAPPPPDLSRRGIHIPTRTSSKLKVKRRLRSSRGDRSVSMPMTPDERERSSADSVISYETSPSSVTSTVLRRQLAPLQAKGPPGEVDRLEPLLEDDPGSFDLLEPTRDGGSKGYSLEKRSDQLFSREHLQAIFDHTPSLMLFTSFLSQARPQSLPILIYYLDALKAMRAINYANAVAEALEPLEGYEFTQHPARPTMNSVLEEKARQAFDVLVREDLPAYITHIFIQTVSISITRRITGTLPPMLREASEGLAEVFCLTDPTRPDNPIIFASEEFHRTTQYGVSYAMGRNCRFLQGPRTNRYAVARFRTANAAGKEHSEVFLNYRRDGSPFMNLLMTAPLLDSRGKLRYFIGAQIDVSGLVKDCTDLEAFRAMLDKEEGIKDSEQQEEEMDEFEELSKMFNMAELETVRKYGGTMHRQHLQEDDETTIFHKPRLLLKDPNTADDGQPRRLSLQPDGRLAGVYKNYLLIRPAPSLRILFTSPSLRVPGILQSRFLDRIGGSPRVRDSLSEALADGSRGVTAKIRWLSSPTSNPDPECLEEGRLRWIHCTPLHGHSSAVGVWMVVLVDDENDKGLVRRFRPAPPVERDVRGWRLSGGFEDLADGEEDDEYMRTIRANGPRNSLLDHLRRNEGGWNSQRGSRAGSPVLGTAAGSISSFALG